MPHECTTCRRVFPDGSKEMLSGCPDCGGNKFQFRPSGSAGDDGGAAGADGRSQAAGGDGVADEPPEPPERSTPGGSVAETVAGATERVRSLVGSDDREWPSVGRSDGRAAEAGGVDAAPGDATEDTAQASARTSVVDQDELPDPPEQPPRASEPAAEDAPGADAAPSASADPDTAPQERSGAPSADAGSRASDDPGTTPFTGNGDSREESPDLSELREELNDQFESIRIVERGQYELNLMELYDRDEYIISLLEDGRYAIEVPETWRDD